MTYQWKIPGLYQLDAEAAGAELERIEKHSRLTQKAVVDASRDETAVLHKCFEWDDQEAAERYRETQAGDIIRNLVAVKVNDVKTEPVRAFVHIGSERSYKSIGVVMKTPEYAEEMLDKARQELASFRRKYSGLKEVNAIIRSIDETFPNLIA